MDNKPSKPLPPVETPGLQVEPRSAQGKAWPQVSHRPFSQGLGRWALRLKTLGRTRLGTPWEELRTRNVDDEGRRLNPNKNPRNKEKEGQGQ